MSNSQISGDIYSSILFLAPLQWLLAGIGLPRINDCSSSNSHPQE